MNICGSGYYQFSICDKKFDKPKNTISTGLFTKVLKEQCHRGWWWIILIIVKQIID